MKIQILADSCCDTTPAIRNMLGIQTAPLKITVEGHTFVDDETINVKQLLAEMKASKKSPATAAPSPEEFAALMRQADASFVITLSKHLSGAYNTAVAAREIVLEETPEKKITIFDSKSASAGELRIAMELHKMITDGATYDQICETIPPFIDNMRTFFVLEDLSNLVKNGRIPKVAGLLGGMLMLRPIMGENGNGEIISIEKVRGTKNALKRLVEMIGERTADLTKKSLTLTLSYCNCPERAASLKEDFLNLCPAIGNVILAPTGGLSTCYANDGGIVLAFA